ncbi:YeeE/YedE family protein [Celerinatantimonas sp. MCCC 1A17872]|uniref:YeeE/YedE family protein n=1 Tax=Celerinatantimonas sp. MCCC 1A17872 TaxID=3177514 RepID=UPI0038C9D4FA
MEHSWIMALIGGALIGAAAFILMLFNGKIAGISGITSALLVRSQKIPLWQCAFVAGLIMAPWLLNPLGLQLPDFHQVNPWMAVVGGFLVGIGTRLGNGCTSGHGVCGVSRLSPRSIVATCVFVAFGMLTASLIH